MQLVYSFFLLFFTVHGFTQKIYQVTEGLTVPVEFREGVKGTSDFTSVKLALVGTISSEAAGASECCRAIVTRQC